jgi:hypothetical protein
MEVLSLSFVFRWLWPAELTGLPGSAKQASIGGSSSQAATADAHTKPKKELRPSGDMSGRVVQLVESGVRRAVWAW